MLPGAALSSPALPGIFIAPRSTPRSSRDGQTTPVSLGGLAVGDASQGLQYQNWTGSVDGSSDIILTPAAGPPANVTTIANLAWFDFTFDQSMRPVISYALQDGTAHFYWFDTTIAAFTTTALPNGTDPWPFVQMDDTRAIEVNSDDVIVAYTRSSNLYFRAQRDRYGTEYSLGGIGGQLLVGMGMSNVNRFQFMFADIQPDQFTHQGKFVGSQVFKAIEVGRAGDIKPRIWPHRRNNTVLS